MKIIGFVHSKGEGRKGERRKDERTKDERTKGEWTMVLKGDSCMLNGRKPLFVPEWTREPAMTPCLILRVSRLGKEIQERFAARYYDAVAPGADFVALDKLREAQAKGQSWTPAIGFDYSLALGEWEVMDEGTKGERTKGEGAKGERRKFEWDGEEPAEWLMTPEQAIAEASRVMTIRQGDLIYIQSRQTPRIVQAEQIIRATLDGEEKLYCKIK